METTRSFISIRIPMNPAVKRAQERLRNIGGVSVPNEVHLTLRFLDNVENRKLERLSESMAALEKHPQFNVSVRGLGAFPNTRNPRVIWIGAALGDTFSELLSDLDNILDFSSVAYDKKPFKAHVTVGRVKDNHEGLTAFLDEEMNLDAGTFICTEILLMGSKLTPNGAVHSIIKSFRLAGI